MKTTMIHARIDPDIKLKVEAIFKQLGLTTTEAIRLFYQQVAFQNGIPFDLSVPNKTTQKAIEDARKGNLLHFDLNALKDV